MEEIVHDVVVEVHDIDGYFQHNTKCWLYPAKEVIVVLLIIRENEYSLSLIFVLG